MTTSEMENDEALGVDAAQAETQEPLLQYDVKVDSKSACERHVVITIPRAEIDRYRTKAFADIAPKAQIPGFRAGKAPRKLVESQFKEQVLEQVKSSLVMDSLQMVTDGGHFSAISEPDFDYNALSLPEEGDFRYEFSIEVRPDFETPKWEGLELKRPVCELTDADIDNHLSRTLTRFIPSEATDEPVALGDTIVLNATFSKDGRELSKLEEEEVVVRKRLIFGDANIQDFSDLVVGKKEGDKFTTNITISDMSENEALRGQEVQAEFEIHEVRRIVVSEIGATQLDSLGFDTLEELRQFVRAELERQFEYIQRQALRKQIVDSLTKDANWEMPESLVRRQTNRELQRQMLELQRSRFTQQQISALMNAARLNAKETTVRALREHFVLEKIAEDLKIEPTTDDYDREIELIAEQTDSSARRVRARLEKTGQMDAIRNQIIEQHVIDRIATAATLVDEPDKSFLNEKVDVSSVDFLVAGSESAIPDAKHNNEPEATPGSLKLPE